MEFIETDPDEPGNPRAGWLLALDTATEQAGIALFDGVQIVELSWPAGRQQTVSMLPAIEWLLNSCGVRLDEIAALGVTTGPGTFTGLRVGLSIAKGMAVLSDRAIVGISTIAVAAEPYGTSGRPVLVTLPAGRGRVVWAVKGTGTSVGEPVNGSLDEFVSVLEAHPDYLLAGELLPEHRERLSAVHDRIVPLTAGTRRPSSLARLAWERWQHGDTDDATAIEPFYLHGRSGQR